jgi:hypothetical protein
MPFRLGVLFLLAVTRIRRHQKSSRLVKQQQVLPAKLHRMLEGPLTQTACWFHGLSPVCSSSVGLSPFYAEASDTTTPQGRSDATSPSELWALSLADVARAPAQATGGLKDRPLFRYHPHYTRGRAYKHEPPPAGYFA